MPSQMSRGKSVTLASWELGTLKAETSGHGTPAVCCSTSDLHGPLASL